MSTTTPPVREARSRHCPAAPGMRIVLGLVHVPHHPPPSSHLPHPPNGLASCLASVIAVFAWRLVLAWMIF